MGQRGRRPASVGALSPAIRRATLTVVEGGRRLIVGAAVTVAAIGLVVVPASAKAGEAFVMSTLAGGGGASPVTNAVSAKTATLGQPLAAAVDPSGNVV